MTDNLIPGMVSVTFRNLTTDRIISLAKDSGLKCIEWGSDVHVPAGSDIAKDVRELSRKMGIIPISYGSYLGKGEEGDEIFSKLIITAKDLGTNNIRIWAGCKNCEDVPCSERMEYVKAIQKCADIAAKDNISLSFECHGSTLTNKPDSALKLIEEIERSNVHLYWQPLQTNDIELNKRIITRFMPYLKNVHVYSWQGLDRLPLSAYEKAWREYISVLKKDQKQHAMLLEFVKDDSTEQLKRDAESLLKWLEF